MIKGVIRNSLYLSYFGFKCVYSEVEIVRIVSFCQCSSLLQLRQCHEIVDALIWKLRLFSFQVFYCHWSPTCCLCYSLRCGLLRSALSQHCFQSRFKVFWLSWFRCSFWYSFLRFFCGTHNTLWWSNFCLILWWFDILSLGVVRWTKLYFLEFFVSYTRVNADSHDVFVCFYE